MRKNFVSFENEETLIKKIAAKFKALGGAYVPRGSLSFENLPTTFIKSMLGYAWNITDDFTTDERFIEGAGKKYFAGENVIVVDNSTTSYSEVTPTGTENPKEEGWFERSGAAEPYTYTKTTDETVDSGKTYYEEVVTEAYALDVIGNFINVDELEAEIKAVQDMISGEFLETTDYSKGDVVIHENKLYQFDSDYKAYTEVTPAGTENPSDEGWYEFDGTDYTKTTDTTVDGSKTYYALNEWDENKVTQVTVVELIQSAEPDSLTTEQLNSLLELLD